MTQADAYVAGLARDTESKGVETMNMQDALETVYSAARAHAQRIADDYDKSKAEATEENEIWNALEFLESHEPCSIGR